MTSCARDLTRTLCGPEMQNLKVDGGEKLGWEPKKMLVTTTDIMLNCTTMHPGFVEALRRTDSFDADLIAKCEPRA